MEEHGIPLDNVVQHNHWNGKDCPKTIRATAGAWEAFLAFCRGEPANVSKLDTDVDTLTEPASSTARTTGGPGTTPPPTSRRSSARWPDYVREDE